MTGDIDTSPARMLLDCAPSLSDDKRKRLGNNARVRWATRVTDEQIADIVERNPRHPGAKLLAWFIGERVSESPLEDLLFPWCDRYDVPRPETQVRLHGFRVDAVYLAEKVVLELDGYDGHGGRESFESDRDRDATLAAYGFIVVRITTWRLKHQPAREAARLLRILEQRLPHSSRRQGQSRSSDRQASPAGMWKQNIRSASIRAYTGPESRNSLSHDSP